MAIENINVGISPNDGTGDALRNAFIKCNDNFDELDFTKQDELVSGTNIKTIEGQSLIGPGNIDLTKSDVGLGNVDNTSDVNKPISSATQTALNAKQDTLVSGTNIKTIEGQSILGSGNIDLQKADVGLANVDNTTDLLKPISTATQTALNLKENLANKSISIPTDGTSDVKYPSAKAVKDYVDGAVALATIPDATTLVKGKIKLAGDLSGTADLPTVPALATKENTITAGTTAQYWRGDKSWQTLNKSAVGLSNVDNTSDANKPISSATQTALNAKQDTLVSGTNIKTINSTSLLGSGNVSVQPTLVSGTNIKTINGNTILGSGDLTISGGITGTGTTNYIPKFNGPDAIQNSQIFDNGTNVGIGTNTPSSTLQVGNGIGIKNILISGASNNLGLGGLSVSFLGFATGTISTVFTSAAVPLGVGTRSTQPLVLGTNNAESMRIDSSGNVGIGTTSLSEKLSISGNIELLGGSNKYIKIGSASNYFYNLQSVGDDFQILEAGITPRLVIKYPNGNVGIGTTSPTTKLQVVGLPEYLTNALAIAGGLTIGAFYHTSGVLKVVI
jgi:hypothetical protein